MDNLLDSWDAAKRAPEPEVQARKSAGDIAIDVVTGREEFREAGRRIEEGDVASGLGLGAFTAATFVLPWGRGGRLAMRGARGLPGVRAARGLGDEFGEFWSPPPAGEPARSMGELSSEASDVLRSAGVEPAEASVLANSVSQLRQQVADTGGFTWDPRSGRVSFDEGYATAVVKGYERPIPLSRFGASDAVDYLKFVPEGQSDTVAQKLAANPRNMVGAWVEPIDGVDHVFMDVSSVIRDRDTALRIGGALNEMGVYGFAERQTLYLRDFPDFLEGGANYTPDALRRFGFEDSVTVSVPEPARPAPRLEVPRSLVRDEGGFAADIPGTRVRELAEELAQRHLDSPTGLAALDPQEIAATLEALPEFAEFVRLYRTMVVDKMTGSLDRRTMRPSSLIEFAGLTGLGTPRWSRGVDASVSFPASLQGSLPQAVRDGAINLGMRIRNMNVFVNDDIYDPRFYVEFNRIINRVEDATGMPREVLASALASASSQAAPYDEVLRFARIAPMVRVVRGVAEPTPGAMELLGSDSMAITALRGLVDTVNRPDFLTFKPAGQAMKTSSYAYGRLDPLYIPTYVSDTVDGLGQFLIKGVEPGLSNAQHSIVNQIAGRTLANLYDVNPGAVQEATWSHIRVARDGIQLTQTGKPTETAIAPAFTGSQGTVEEVLVAAIERMDKNVVRLARQNRDKFHAEAKAGKLRAWEWDAPNNRPVISSSEYLIPADQRLKVAGRAGILQAQMLQLVESLSPALRGRLTALATVLSMPVTSLAAAMGAAGAVLGGLQGVAEASEGEGVTLAAGPVAGGMAAGAAMGAAAGGSFGILAAQALRGARAVRGLARRRKINSDIQVPIGDEADIVERTLDESRREFLLRTSGTRQGWESLPGAENAPFLGDAPIGRLVKDYHAAMSDLDSYIAGAQSAQLKPWENPTANAKRALLDTRIDIPFDTFELAGPSFATFIEAFLIRAFNGGRGGNVVWRAMGDGSYLNGGALRDKYIVQSVTEDFIQPRDYVFREAKVASAQGRREILHEWRKIEIDLGVGIVDDPQGVFYAYNTDTPSYQGKFTFNRSNVFSRATIDEWGDAVTNFDEWGDVLAGMSYNEARELVFMSGTLANSLEEAFRLAAQRGQLFVKEAATGQNIRVPAGYVGDAVSLDRIVIPPSSPGRNIAPYLDEDFDGKASRWYLGRARQDETLDAIYELQGFNRPTELVSADEAQILIQEHGFLPVYRGIEFEGIIEARAPNSVLRAQIEASEYWKRGFASLPEARREAIIADIIEQKRMAEHFYQDDFMDLWFSQNEKIWTGKTIEGLAGDLAYLANNSTKSRSMAMQWAEEIFGPLAKPENLIYPDKMVRELAVGTYYPGSGSHGSGTYTTPNLQRAMGYAGISPDGDMQMAKSGFVYGMLLKPDAKIMGPAEHRSFVKALRFWPDQIGFDDVGNKLATSPWGPELSQFFTVRDIDPGVFEYSLRQSFGDVGRAISALGYDGYIPYTTVYDGYFKPEYVLLNRQSFVVINYPIEPIVIQERMVSRNLTYDTFTFSQASKDYPRIEVPLQ